MKSLYLDANAHVPMSKETLKSFSDFSNSIAAHGHPLSPSVIGRKAAGAIEEARGTIAELIGAKDPGQIIFTNSCTQACEWVGRMVMGEPDPPSWTSVSISPIEHPAVKQAFNCTHQMWPVTSDGVVEFDDVEDEFGICIHMQNEIGTIQPIADIPATYCISDMCQSLGKIPVNVTELNVDYAMFGAHKFGGPSGVGFIYLKDTKDWEEFGTGSRYYMDIPGTPNVGAIVSTAVGLRVALETLPGRSEKMVSFRDCLESGLKGLGFEIVGESAERCPNTTFAKVPGKFNAGMNLMLKLGKKNIHVGMGSACGSLHMGGSPLMEALGRPSDGQDYVRISQWGEYGKSEAEYLLGVISEAI